MPKVIWPSKKQGSAVHVSTGRVEMWGARSLAQWRTKAACWQAVQEMHCELALAAVSKTIRMVKHHLSSCIQLCTKRELNSAPSNLFAHGLNLAFCLNNSKQKGTISRSSPRAKFTFSLLTFSPRATQCFHQGLWS